eukprot:CAMPEP_0201250894 /NCGR_PEP_ID=MMETSP0852-20130820/65256_1 /ASSEMBLY_ACC=CAM_ASM_000632 /TAXON_ID=183588 /ORGANISM="Pseudo-nitzschia fraudulenta, Strain WWA7" /LENGTH=41 /DNA_ID= /DNA_START= /DNA_END= /DNA_ORIENTATION=
MDINHIYHTEDTMDMKGVPTDKLDVMLTTIRLKNDFFLLCR